MTAFDIVFDRVISVEGGYSNIPADSGGETNWGISKRAYPALDIKTLTREDAKAIYKRDYWDRLACDGRNPAVAFQMFDFAVNSGVGAVLKMLPFTGSDAKIIVHLLSVRLGVMTSSSAWPTFGKGWARRIASDLELAAADLA